MKRELLEQLAFGKGIYDCLCDPYDKHKTGDNYGSVMDDLERFAELIIFECGEFCGQVDRDAMFTHFGVEK